MNKPLACDQVPSITISPAPFAHSGCCGRLQMSTAEGDIVLVKVLHYLPFLLGNNTTVSGAATALSSTSNL